MSFQVMRRRLLSAVAAVGALAAGPAAAVDYVQCREMLRVKNEMIEKADEYQVAANVEYIEARCPKPPLSNVTWEASIACTIAAHELRRLTQEQTKIDPLFYEDWKLVDKTLDSPKAIKYYKIALRAAEDMRKAGCPYQ
jgi:uncharacterized protein (DUF2344 family)